MEIADPSEFVTAIERNGWAATGPVIPEDTIQGVLHELALISPAEGVNRSRRGGVRNLLEHAVVRELACSSPVRSVAQLVLGSACFAARAILFDKTAAANWKVIWHQDLTIAVERRVATPGFCAWTNKSGVPHVQAPVALLGRMLAIRVHLDRCGLENGPLRFLPGSHLVGRLSANAIAQWRTETLPIAPTVERGGLLAFRPLLLHASSQATAPAHRRVVHIEFAAEDLPAPLRWSTRVSRQPAAAVPCTARL